MHYKHYALSSIHPSSHQFSSLLLFLFHTIEFGLSLNESQKLAHWVVNIRSMIDYDT